MVEVWQVTRDEFVGDFSVNDDDLEELDRTFQYEIEHFGRDWLPRTMRPVPGQEGFFFADVKGQPENVVLLQEDPVDGTFDVVGGYIDEYLWLDGGPSGKGGVRGRGLSAELVLAKFEKVGVGFNVISYTSAGKAAHESAHRLAVQRALRAGYPVPRRVLADYPEFEAVPPEKVVEPVAQGRRPLTAKEVAARLMARRAAEAARTRELEEDAAPAPGMR